MTVRVFERTQGGRVALAGDATAALASGSAVWIDLFQPTVAEDTRVESLMGDLDIPTLQDRAGLEESSRFYEEDGALYLTPELPGRSEDGTARMDAVTFILSRGRLVTVRTVALRAFEIGEGRASTRIAGAGNGADVFLALMEAVIERIADLLQEATGEAELLSARIFRDEAPERDLRKALRTIGRLGATAARCSTALSSLKRTLAFASSVCTRHGLRPEPLRDLVTDVAELERAASALQSNLGFLLNSALGLISASQNTVLKVISVATILFAPPMLISSFFGMNFEHFSLLAPQNGVTLTALAMLASALAVWLVGRSRAWF